MAKKKEEKETNKMQDLIASLNKEVGNIVFKEPEGDTEKIKLGAIKIDYALGGGLPKGRVVELMGWESCNKTTYSLMYMKAFLDENKENIAMYVDAEYAHDKGYMKALGIDLDRVIIVTPDTTEDTFKAILTASKHGVGFVLVDSVSAMMSLQEFEKGMDGNTIGNGAKTMSTGLKMVIGDVRKNNMACIFTNQFRTKIGVLYGDPRTTSGGNAMKFYASIRVEMKATRTKKGIETGEEGEAVANDGSLYVIKNKVAPPFREANFRVEFGKGIDIVLHNIKTALEEGIIEKGGAWFTIPLKDGSTNKLQGEQTVIDFYKDPKNKEEYDYLYHITDQQFN